MSPDFNEGTDRAVDRFWDHVAQGGSGAAGGLDPADASTIRHLHAFDDRPGPSRAFVRRLREELMHAHAIPGSSDLSPSVLPNGRAAQVPWPASPTTPRSAGRRRWGIAPLATAALLLLTLGLGYAAFGPGRPTGLQPAVVPAVVATPEAAPAEETLFAVTLPAAAFPQTDTIGSGIADATLAPGTRSTWRPTCCPGPMVEYVVAGTYTVRAEAPIQVVRGDGTVEEVAAGTEVVLGPGDGLVSRNETTVEAANTGTTPVTLLNWVLVDDPDVVFGGHVLRDWVQSNAAVQDGIVGPTGPVTLRLRRVSLAADSILPAPPSGVFQFGVTLPKANADGTSPPSDLSQLFGGSIRNNNQQAVALYVVTLEPAGNGGGTPAALTPAR